MLDAISRRSSHFESISDWPAYVDFAISLSLSPKTYRYGTYLRLEFLLSQLDVSQRQQDETICENLGYALPSPEEPLPESYRALKSRAVAYREKWLASRTASNQLNQNKYSAAEGSYGKAA
jgi:hypothetical protein